MFWQLHEPAHTTAFAAGCPQRVISTHNWREHFSSAFPESGLWPPPASYAAAERINDRQHGVLSCNEFQDCGCEHAGSLLRHVVSDHRNDPALIAAGEEAGLVVPCLRRCHAVAAPLQYDGWHTDRWLRRQPPLDLFEIRVARSVTETMAVGMDDNVDEIRIVEGRGRALVGRIIEFPIR